MTKVTQKEMIQGSVKHQGLPVSGIEVRLYSSNSTEMNGHSPNDIPFKMMDTDPKGQFEFKVDPGTYSIQAIPRGDSRLLKECVYDVTLDKKSIKCDISLKPGILLNGTLRTKSGDKVQAGEVFAIGIEPTSYWTFAPVDYKGNFTLVLPKGKFHVGCRGTAHQYDPENAFGSDSNFYYVSKQVRDVEIYRDLNFELELPKLFKFEGLVADAAGFPVIGAKVTLIPKDLDEASVIQELNFSSNCYTDKAGRFEIYLESGLYDLDLVPDLESKQFGISDTDIKVDGSLERKYVLEEGHKLSGRVLYKEKPMANMRVRIQSMENDREFIAESNIDGEFAASIPPGIYKLVVSKDTTKGVRDEEDEKELDLAPWAKEIVVGGDTHVGIKLASGKILKGSIKDDSGNARSQIKITVYSRNKENRDKLTESSMGRMLAQTTTDSKGNFMLSLADGEYWLVVHKDFESARKVEINSDFTEIDISWHGWCQLSFVVEGEDGSPIPRCKVIYKPYRVNKEDSSNNFSPQEVELPSGYVITDGKGSCRMTIPSGIYSFEFSPPPAGSYSTKEIRQLSIIADAKKTVSLPKKIH